MSRTAAVPGRPRRTTIATKVDDDTLARLDAARGSRSRSAYLWDVLASALVAADPALAVHPQIPGAHPPPVAAEGLGWPAPQVVIDEAQRLPAHLRDASDSEHRHREHHRDEGPVRNGVRLVTRYCLCGAELPPLTMRA